MNDLTKLKGCVITGTHTNLFSNQFTLIINEHYYITFNECLLIYNNGIEGHVISLAEEYNGEMGFVLDARVHRIDIEEYRYFRFTDNNEDWQLKKQIRIMCKSFDIIKDSR